MSIKVLHCLETIGTGGVEQRRLSLANHLSKGLFKQFLVCSKSLAHFDRKLEKSGTTVFCIGEMRSLFNLEHFIKLSSVVRKVKPTIIHGAVFEGVIASSILGAVFRIPIIIIEETSDPQNRSWRGHLLLRILSYFADFVIAISPSVEAYLKNTAKIPERKIRLINNGVASPRSPNQEELEMFRKNMGITKLDFVIGSVGRLRDFHKRFSDLIKAMSLLKKDAPNCKLLIVGEGEDRAKLTELVKDLALDDHVIFAGFQADTSLFYGCMDIFALASHMEGFGLVVAEAMSHKLPTVVTAVGGMKDIVLHGETGFLVERHSPPQLAQAILSLYQNPELRKVMGANGFERAKLEYSAEKYVEKVEALYCEALSLKGIVHPK